jgi:hypothetical protein
MPYHIEESAGQYCVYKDGEVEPMQCYDSEADAIEYLTALNIATADEVKAESYTPPATVADNARMALEVRAEKPPSQRGMTSIGIARASQLANRRPVSIDTIERMVAYFDRHEVDKDGATWSEQGKGWQAWMGWGGDEGRAWANQIMKEYDMSETKSVRDVEVAFMTKDSIFYLKDDDGEYYIANDNMGDFLRTLLSLMGYSNADMAAELKSNIKASRRHSEADMKLIRSARRMAIDIAKSMFDLGDDGDEAMEMDMEPKAVKAIEMGAEFNTRQRMMVSSLVEVTHEAGKFDWGVGANGAHYMPTEQNPFASQGIACEHCFFYQPTVLEGYGQCAIVEGMVEEYGVCKLWIIPEDTITEETAEAAADMIEDAEDDAMIEAEIASEGGVQKALDNPTTIEVSDAAKALARRLLGR